MLDLHCHILPGVDDGPDEVGAAVEMARALVAAGVTAVAASPHVGGPGGDVTRERAEEARQQLRAELARAGVALEVLPNAEHHITPELLDRASSGHVIPIGGRTRWLLVELPWNGLASPEQALFLLRAKGLKLLLAHPERHDYLSLDVVERLVEQGVKMQVTMASFTGAFGAGVRERAEAIFTRELLHVLASDLHRPRDTRLWLDRPLEELRSRCGAAAVKTATRDNPMLILEDAAGDNVKPASCEGRRKAR